MPEEDKQDGKRGVVESNVCVASRGGYLSSSETLRYRPGIYIVPGDLELEGRDVDGRVGTCPHGTVHVPSACPG